MLNRILNLTQRTLAAVGACSLASVCICSLGATVGSSLGLGLFVGLCVLVMPLSR